MYAIKSVYSNILCCKEILYDFINNITLIYFFIVRVLTWRIYSENWLGRNRTRLNYDYVKDRFPSKSVIKIIKSFTINCQWIVLFSIYKFFYHTNFLKMYIIKWEYFVRNNTFICCVFLLFFVNLRFNSFL